MRNQYISVFYFCAFKKKVKIAKGLGFFFPPLTICEKNKKFTLRLKRCMPSFCLELIFTVEL